MRVALVDPLAYTPPYDDALAAALARRGHAVTLLTSPFLYGDAPEPAGYEREELFLPVSSRLFARVPRARVRRAVKALEYGPGFGMLLNRLKRLEPDVVHVQWLPRPELDERWIRRLRQPSVLTTTFCRAGRRRSRSGRGSSASSTGSSSIRNVRSRGSTRSVSRT